MEPAELEKCLNNPDYLAKKYFFSQKYCNAYEKEKCEGDIVMAHTISKKHLTNIADNGHIYLPVPSHHHQDYFYEIKRKGIKAATKISGFCQHHDVSLFKSFEQSDFNCTYQQIYDITFRALCREYFQKTCLFQFCNRISTGGDLNSLDRKDYTNSNDFRDKQNHILKELKDHEYLYKQLKKYKKKGLKYLVITLEKLPLMTTGVFFPLLSPDNGKLIQSMEKKQLGFIYNTLTTKNFSYIIIATVKTLSDIYRVYLNRLASMNNEKLLNLFLNIAFFNNDNIVINPCWFEQLNSEFQRNLKEIINHQVGQHANTCLLESPLDFSKVVESSIVKICKVVS